MALNLKPNYKKTLRACYLGFVTQAIAANFAPLIFLKLHKDYQIPLGLIALIPALIAVFKFSCNWMNASRRYQRSFL